MIINAPISILGDLYNSDFWGKPIDELYRNEPSLRSIMVITLQIIFLFILVIGPFSLIIIVGVKIFTKNIYINMDNEYMNINNGRKIIYYASIVDLKLKPIIPKGGFYKDKATGYILNIKFENKKNIKHYDEMKIVVYTGTSKNEKQNVESLLNLYNELKELKIINETENQNEYLNDNLLKYWKKMG